jgi:hypothetical protein
MKDPSRLLIGAWLRCVKVSSEFPPLLNKFVLQKACEHGNTTHFSQVNTSKTHACLSPSK